MRRFAILISVCIFGAVNANADQDHFMGEIRFFAGNFAPEGWALCNGQTLLINDYTALFSIIGTIYGGDGQTTFKLPDMRGRMPLHVGKGPGLTSRNLGIPGGSETARGNNYEINPSRSGTVLADQLSENMPPFLPINCIISLNGPYPSRSN